MDLEGLSFVCNGLGFAVDGAYHLHEFCLENMKDLQRFLRRDNPQTRDVFKQVCKFNTVAVDLVPIIEQHHGDRDLLITAVKVLVFMTMPIDPTSDNIAQQVECSWNLKASLTRNDTVAAIASLLEEPLEHFDRDAFTEDDFNLVQLVLTLFRNLLAIHDLSLHQKVSGTSTQFLCLAERFLEILFSENVMELILVVTQHISGSDGYLYQDNLLLLDIFHHVFLGQKPELIANPSREDLKGDGNAATSLNSLKSIMEEEDMKRRAMRLQKRNHSPHIGGTFVRYNMDGSRMLLKGKPSVDPADSLIKAHKVQRGPLKRIMWDNESVSMPSGNFAEQLHDFAEQFLSGGYNILMQSIREDIEKDHHAVQDNEVMNFFQVARFFTAYQRYKFSHTELDTGAAGASSMGHHKDGELFHGAVCGPIADTMKEAMFNLVLSKWHYAFDSLKQTSNYKFLSSSGSLMKEMIRILDLVLKLSGRESAGEAYTARILLHKIFYDQTEEGITCFLLNLMKSFDTRKQPRSDLADMLEMVHIIFRLMETLQSHGALRVSKKSRKRSKKKLQGNQVNHIAELASEHLPSDIAADIEVNINAAPSTSSPLSGGGSPKGESCLNTTSNCDEYVSLREHEMPLNGTGNVESRSREIATKGDSSNHNQACQDESSEDDQQAALVEVNLDISHIVSMFANCMVVQNLCWLLKFYKSNRANTNHYIICMLRRISDDLKLTPMLFQLSILCIFYKILHDQKRAAHKEYKNIVSFVTKVVGELMNKLKSHPLLFVEILFWKTNRECRYIDSGFLLHEIGTLRSKTKKWIDNSVGVEGGDPNKTGSHINIADALGDDEADLAPPHEFGDHISHAGSPQNASDQGEDEIGLPNPKASVSAEVCGMDNNNILGRCPSKQDLVRAPKIRKGLVFDPVQEDNVRRLYEIYKGRRRCASLISKSLSPDRKITPAEVSRKLKELDLVVTSKEKKAGTVDSGEDEIQGADSIEKLTEFKDTSPTNIAPHSGKRIKAFSKEQEILIKELFEQFKTEKRCNHLIANALGSNKKYSAAKVSRKLKQLGLHRPQQDGIGDDKKSRKSSSNLVSTEKEQSDNETLSAHRKRLKKNAKSKVPQEASMLSMAVTCSERTDASDDEPLGLMLKKKEKEVQHMVMNEGCTTSAVQEDVTDNDLEALSLHAEMSLPAQSDEAGNSKDPSMPNLNTEGILERKTSDSASGYDGLLDREENDDSGSVQVEKTKRRVLLQKSAVETDYSLADEVSNLEDDLDDMSASVIRSRKRHRVMFDLEDD